MGPKHELSRQLPDLWRELRRRQPSDLFALRDKLLLPLFGKPAFTM